MSANLVTAHYTRGDLEGTLVAALTAAGHPVHPDRDSREPPLDTDVLAPVDEFHIGGRTATVALLDQLPLQPGTQVLDIGSGLGGTARHLAVRHGVEVIGIDLTPEYVDAARLLSRLTGLHARTSFQHGDATAMPFPDASFDAATLLHVGMNIPDKARLFQQVHRVLRPGSPFGIYDVMRAGAGEVTYPVPWAGQPAASFLAEPNAYLALLDRAGFNVRHQRDRSDFALDFLLTLQARAGHGPPPLGLNLVMGAEFRSKVTNMIDALRRRVIAPVEIIAFAG